MSDDRWFRLHDLIRRYHELINELLQRGAFTSDHRASLGPRLEALDDRWRELKYPPQE